VATGRDRKADREKPFGEHRYLAERTAPGYRKNHCRARWRMENSSSNEKTAGNRTSTEGNNWIKLTLGEQMEENRTASRNTDQKQLHSGHFRSISPLQE
jgi:hypothetical protein